MTIRTAIQDFLVEIEIRKYTIRTQRGYKTNLNVFATYCEEELQITDMDDVDMVVVKRFTQRMIQLGHKGTYHHKVRMHLENGRMCCLWKK